MKKALLFSFLCFAVSTFAFADGLADKTKDLPKNANVTITAPAAIAETTAISPALPMITPPKPWVVATQCEYGQGPVVPYFFDTEAEAMDFASAWCSANNTGGCNWSLYFWLRLIPPFIWWEGAVLIRYGSCQEEVAIDG